MCRWPTAGSSRRPGISIVRSMCAVGFGEQSGVTETLTSLASTRLAERHEDLAFALAQQAADNAVAHDQPELLWRAQTVAGMALHRLRHTADARRALGDAVGSIERLALEVTDSESLRQRFLEDKLSPYHELIALSIEGRSYSEALEIAERSKGRVLAQLLKGTRVDETTVLTEPEKLERVGLRNAMASLNRQIEAAQEKRPPDDARVQTLEAGRRKAREEFAAFEAAMVVQHPALSAVRGVVTPLTYTGASQLVTDPSMAIIEYVVAERQLFAFLLTSDGARVTIDGTAIPIASTELGTRVERFRHQIASRDLGFSEDARALYDSLIGPFRGRLAGKSHVIIVPDGALWTLPFQALRGPEGFLIETTAISYAPSLTVLREILRLPRRTGSRTLLAMAKSSFGASLEPLPDAQGQVQAIQQIYGAEHSATYVGDAATERQFRAAASQYRSSTWPPTVCWTKRARWYSRLVLSAAAETPDDDGRLEAWEIMRMKIAADVVVLAACDAGRGRIAPGEGVIGMMWALFAAGARSMVVSQFRVESGSAAALLVGFHRGLADGRGSKAADLRAATLALLHTAEVRAPVLLGRVHSRRRRELNVVTGSIPRARGSVLA